MAPQRLPLKLRKQNRLRVPFGRALGSTLGVVLAQFSTLWGSICRPWGSILKWGRRFYQDLDGPLSSQRRRDFIVTLCGQVPSSSSTTAANLHRRGFRLFLFFCLHWPRTRLCRFGRVSFSCDLSLVLLAWPRVCPFRFLVSAPAPSVQSARRCGSALLFLSCFSLSAVPSCWWPSFVRSMRRDCSESERR